VPFLLACTQMMLDSILEGALNRCEQQDLTEAWLSDATISSLCCLFAKDVFSCRYITCCNML
jgi:hypothetical protein